MISTQHRRNKARNCRGRGNLGGYMQFTKHASLISKSTNGTLIVSAEWAGLRRAHDRRKSNQQRNRSLHYCDCGTRAMEAPTLARLPAAIASRPGRGSHGQVGLAFGIDHQKAVRSLARTGCFHACQAAKCQVKQSALAAILRREGIRHA